MRVLVVEDFEVLAAAIGTGLRREGMAVDVALDGDDALEHLAVTRSAWAPTTICPSRSTSPSSWRESARSPGVPSRRCRRCSRPPT